MSLKVSVYLFIIIPGKKSTAIGSFADNSFLKLIVCRISLCKPMYNLICQKNHRSNIVPVLDTVRK